MRFTTAFAILASASAACPYLSSEPLGTSFPASYDPKAHQAYRASLSDVDWVSLKSDIIDLLHSSDPKWPSDYGNYGPFFIRLAWHTSGSYRTSDGRGGAEGGRQRFEPERSWDDNTNLDKARSLLWSIKSKYPTVSWGDLFIATGTFAIEDMGGPSLGFCAGRVDDVDGSDSLPLGPTPEQEALAPCVTNGDCHEPLGTTTIGLIYVNPEGPMGVPDPERSAPQVRDTFGRMAMDDRETVALIGGGHTFGKTHGACPDGAGDAPNEDPENPWAGNCGSGVGVDAFTSGFEGPWTTSPTSWTEGAYFRNLLEHSWEVHVGPGGHNQWRVSNETSPSAPSADGEGSQDIMMLTSDISLVNDEAYFKIVTEYAENPDVFADEFMHAWYKLTTRDMGPIDRCRGPFVPPAQPFQYPLPTPPPADELFDVHDVKIELRKIASNSFVRLAAQSAFTFRRTDYLGGVNGARIRFSPEADFVTNDGLDEALKALDGVRSKFKNLSYADLIALAGTVSLEEEFDIEIPYCSGRTDAEEGDGGSDYLAPKITGADDDELVQLLDLIDRLALSKPEFVAVMGARPYGGKVSGVKYFKALANGKTEEDFTMTDELLTLDPSLMSIVQEFSLDGELHHHALEMAWGKLMTADLFYDLDGYCS